MDTPTGRGKILYAIHYSEGSVGCDLQVSMTEEIGIIRNDIDDQRRVERWGPWQ